MHIDLTPHIILVTGASRGIGAAIAKALGKAGATVALHYGRSAEKAEALAKEIGNDSKAFQADFYDPDSVKGLFEAVMTHYGRIDTLVNNAGIALQLDENAAMPDMLSNWQQTLQVNLVAAAQLCHLLIPHFREKGGGRFIHVASRAAFRGDTVDFMAYAASKAGMVALSRSLARGYGKIGIKSFVLAPGFIKTDMAQQFIDEYGEAYVKDDLALDELTLPEHLAPAVTLMASGMMDHATGSVLDMNAGSYVR